MKDKIDALKRHFSAEKELQKIGNHWSRLDEENKKKRLEGAKKERWWQFPQIHQHINSNIDGGDAEHGFITSAINKHKILPCERGVSVGFGNGVKEIKLLKMDLVQHFDLYELSSGRVENAKALAKKEGLSDRISFHLQDVFDQAPKKNHYDLVYWNQSLHHMLDVPRAVEWSRDVLKPGGGLLMNDFIGPSRFQWSDEELAYATRARRCFVDTHYLASPQDPSKSIPIEKKRPSVQAMYDADPSEAADSGRIVDALKEYFPNVDIQRTGGVIYHLALNGMLMNFDEHKDQHIIKLLLMIDDLLVEKDLSHYALAFATK